MELKWLEDFISLANARSFSKAAEDRNVTQSAFSRRIMALEEWLGTTLIDRKSHPITLTDDGTRFVETARQSVRMFHKVRNDFSAHDSKKRRSLSIGIADHLAIHFFPSWLQTIQSSFPNHYFDLLSSIRSGPSFFESLRLQEFDLLICYSRVVNSTVVDPKNYSSLTLGAESLLPVGKASVIKSGVHSLPGTSNRPLPYISYKSYSSLAKAIQEMATLSGVSPIYLDPVLETSSAQSVKALVKQGYGIAWLPESAIRRELESGEFKEIGGEEYRIPLTINIHRYIPNTKPLISEFWETLTTLLASRELRLS